MLSRPSILLALLIGVAVAMPANAGAATFCVNFSVAAECSGTKEASVEAAIAAASGSAGRDTIKIAGGHFYEEPSMNDTIGNPVDIVGVGVTQPILSATTPGATALTVENETSTLTNLQLTINGDGSTGMVFHGAVATKIQVAGLAAGNGSLGVDLRHGTLRESTVEMAHSATVATDAVEASDGTAIEGSTLAATEGVFGGCCDPHLTISRVKTLGPVGIRATQGGHVTVDNSLLLISGVVPGHGTSAAFTVSDAFSGPSSLDVDNVTAVDVGGSAEEGVLASAENHNETVTIRDSIVRGFGVDLRTLDPGAVIDADYDDYSTALASAGVIKAGAHDLDVDPGFVNFAGADFHLAADSPLIDRGDPAGSTASVDFYGAPRLSAGLGSAALLDIGAAEFPPGAGPGGGSELAPEGGAGEPLAESPPAPPRAAAPELVLSTARRHLGRRGTFTYALSCPAGLPGPCEGTLTLATSGKVKVGGPKGGKASRRVLSFGAKRFTIASGSNQQLVFKPDARDRRLLAELRTLRLTATASATVADSAAGVSGAKFDLLAPS